MSLADPTALLNVPAFTGVVLAGGYSRRMGCDKALIGVSGKTRLERQAQTLLEAGAGEVMISCRSEQPYGGLGFPLVFDEFRDLGPIGGICAALARAQNPLVCILAVDLPKLPPEYLRMLLSQCRPGMGVIPRRGNFYEPLAAFYPRAACELALARVSRGLYSLQSLVEEGIKQRQLTSIPILDREESYFFNYNSPEPIE